MSPRSLLSTTTLFVGLAVALIASVPNSAQAQGLIDFLWGGGKEWGGEKQTVKFDPKYTPGQIIVSFGDRRLYHITAPGVAESYPIAVPREKSRWQGTTTVSMKKENPSWRPTQEMLSENPKLPHWVPGGHPMNPLGVRALYLGSSAYRIHGTDAPWTIGKAVSQGCIRMYNKDVIELYPKIKVGTRVTVTWQRFNTKGVVTAYGDDAPPPSYSPFSKTRRVMRSRSISSRAEAEFAESEAAPVVENVEQYVESRPEAPVAKSSVIREPKTSAEAKPAAKPEKVAAVKKAEANPVEKPTAKADEPKAEPAKVETAKTEQPKPAAAKATDAVASDAASKPVEKTKTAAVATKDNPVDVAKRAAAAAARAATAAKEAAEAARKAAAAAKKATSAKADDGDGKKDDVPGRRAAL